MTPEQQRIAIAEACGWRIDPKEEDGALMGWHSPEESWDMVPDYPSDLNAMHEALGLIIDDQEAQVRYADEIIKLCGKNRIACHNASAAQRAEAFLRTLNLWKD